MRVGFFTTSLSRGAGGIFETGRRLSQSLLHFPGTEVEVFGIRDQYLQEDLGSWWPILPKVYNSKGPDLIQYAPNLAGDMIRDNLQLGHLHVLWRFPTLATLYWYYRTGRPYLISINGFLDGWALNHSRWSKRIVSVLYEKRCLRKAACLHALTEAEYHSIRAYGLKNPVCIIPNGVDLPVTASPTDPPPWITQTGKDKKILLYLGRIHPKKGLVPLLYAWKRLLQNGGQKSWNLVIAGWDQQGHEEELKKIVQEEGLGASVHFIGPQFNGSKDSCYAHADAFILPSYSEGLPMVILEAWAWGLPVLMTKECNLPEGFKEGAALPIELTEEKMVKGLEQVCSLDDEQLATMGNRGSRLVAASYSWQRSAARMHEVYRWLLHQGPQPGCVRLD